MTKLSLKRILFYLGVVFLSCLLFSPFFASMLVDWSKPASVSRVQKPVDRHQEELNGWQKRQAEAKKEKRRFSEPTPKKYTIETKWDIDDYGFFSKPAYLCKKLNVPLAPHLLLVWPAYLILAALLLHYYKRSELFFHGAGESILLIWPVIQVAMIILTLIAAIILNRIHEITPTIADQELRQAAQVAMDHRLTSLMLMVFPMICAVFFSGLMVLFCYGQGSDIPKACGLLLAAIESPFVGTRIKLSRKGRVQVRNISLEMRDDWPRLKRTKYLLTLPEFLHHARSLLLGNVSARFIKQYQGELTEQLRWEFRSLCRRIENIPSGDAIPRDLRFLVRKGDKAIAVIQQPPAVRRINFAPLVLEREKSKLKAKGSLDRIPDELLARTSLDLAFPYCLFLVALHKGKFESLWAYWSKSSLDSIHAGIYQFSFYNIREDGHVCTGDGNLTRSSLARTCDAVIDDFWNGSFSYHHTEPYDKLRGQNRRLSTLYHWHQTSIGHPDFMCGIRMDGVLMKTDGREIQNSLSDRIEHLTKDEKDIADVAFNEFVDDVLSGKPLPVKVLESKSELKADIDQLFEIIKAAKEKES